MTTFNKIEISRSLTGNIVINTDTSITIFTKLELAMLEQCFDSVDELIREVGFFTTDKAMVFPDSKLQKVRYVLSETTLKFAEEKDKLIQSLPNKIRALLERKPELSEYSDIIKNKADEMVFSYKLEAGTFGQFDKVAIFNHDVDAMLLDLNEQLKYLLTVTARSLRTAIQDEEKFLKQNNLHANLTLVELDRLVKKCRVFGLFDSKFLNYGHCLSVLSYELEQVDVFNGSTKDMPKLKSIILELIDLVCSGPASKLGTYPEIDYCAEIKETSFA